MWRGRVWGGAAALRHSFGFVTRKQVNPSGKAGKGLWPRWGHLSLCVLEGLVKGSDPLASVTALLLGWRWDGICIEEQVKNSGVHHTHDLSIYAVMTRSCHIVSGRKVGLMQSFSALRILGLLGMPVKISKTQCWLSLPPVDPTVLDMFMKLFVRGRASATTTVLDSVLVGRSTLRRQNWKAAPCPLPGVCSSLSCREWAPSSCGFSRVHRLPWWIHCDGMDLGVTSHCLCRCMIVQVTFSLRSLALTLRVPGAPSGSIWPLLGPFALKRCKGGLCW